MFIYVLLTAELTQSREAVSITQTQHKADSQPEETWSKRSHTNT